MPSPRASALSGWLILALALAGCDLFGGPSNVRTIRSAGTEAPEAHSATVFKMIDRLAQRVRNRRDSRLEILLISGGGQQSAYAAGFLRGWVTRTEPSLPKFDLVAGVSTGALLAPFALVGTPPAIERAATVFRSDAVEIAATPNFWPQMQRTAGLPDDAPYRAAIERIVDDTLQSEVRTEFDSLRQIMVSTSDFDLGTLRMWDLGHEIGTTPKGIRRAHALLMASASTPGVYPPILVDNHVHATGEVFGTVFAPLAYEDYRNLVRRLRAHGVTETVTVQVYVILNGFVQPLRDPVDPDDRRAMAARASSLLFSNGLAQTVERLTLLTQSVNGGVRGLRMELRLSMIPAALAEEPGAGDRYHEDYAMQLEQVAYERARGEGRWDVTIVPRDRDDD